MHVRVHDLIAYDQIMDARDQIMDACDQIMHVRVDDLIAYDQITDACDQITDACDQIIDACVHDLVAHAEDTDARDPIMDARVHDLGAHVGDLDEEGPIRVAAEPFTAGRNAPPFVRPQDRLRRTPMRLHRLAVLAALVAIGCAKPPPVAEQGQALAAAGKLPEAADKLAAACAVEPDKADCASIERRAAETRIEAARRAMAEGRYLAAERLVEQAMLTDAAPLRDQAAAMLRAEELATGRRYELALALPDRHMTMAAMEAIVHDKAPPNAATKRAAEWIEKERPALIAADVTEACKPDAPPAFSCAAAYAELRKASGSGPAWEAAEAAGRAETARLYPLRVKAEQMIGLYVAFGRIDRKLADCVSDAPLFPEAAVAPSTADAGAGDADAGAGDADAGAADAGAPYDPTAKCRKSILPDDAVAKRDRHDRAFQDLLAEVRDPFVVSELAARRDKALADGKVDKIEIEKPEEAKR
jgi:hypothetical protein